MVGNLILAAGNDDAVCGEGDGDNDVSLGLKESNINN